MVWALALVRRAGLDVVGFQEFQGPQHAVFRKLTGDDWEHHPDAARAGRAAQNAIAWRTAEWRLRDTGSVDVPYFFGRMMPMPYVRLRHLDSGTDVWFLNVHNPANKFGDAARWRREALTAEVALVNRLRAGGDPVVVTGDFNDREKAFCTMTARAGLRASAGGSWAGGCTPPSPPRIDWIFATTDVSLRDHVREATGLVQRTSDHALVHARAVLPNPPTG
jgi:endonuclease/exonuclease/phosphatase family metal-dependent hydrolase